MPTIIARKQSLCANRQAKKMHFQQCLSGQRVCTYVRVFVSEMTSADLAASWQERAKTSAPRRVCSSTYKEPFRGDLAHKHTPSSSVVATWLWTCVYRVLWSCRGQTCSLGEKRVKWSSANIWTVKPCLNISQSANITALWSDTQTNHFSCHWW